MGWGSAQLAAAAPLWSARLAWPHPHRRSLPPRRTIANQKNIEIDLNRLHWTPYRNEPPNAKK